MKSFKIIAVLWAGVFLSACNYFQASILEVSEPSLKPEPLPVEDDSGNVLGFATPVSSSVLVIPDHLWQVSEGLYVNDQPIEVLARDFRHDLLFLTVQGLALPEWPQWSDKPPGVGQPLTWEKADESFQASVFSARAEFEINNVVVEDLMLLPVSTDPGTSGLPLYDGDSNRIYGMLIASDTIEDVSYFVRSDVILSLLREYLGL